MRRHLLRREPAVDDELRTHHAAGVVAGEEDDAVGHFVRGDQAADRLFNLDLIEQLLDGSKFCNISIHKVWPILFFISLAANVVLVVVLVKKNGTKKKNQVDNTPLVDYDISDDE